MKEKHGTTIEPFACCSRWQECTRKGDCVQEGELRGMLRDGCMLNIRLRLEKRNKKKIEQQRLFTL